MAYEDILVGLIPGLFSGLVAGIIVERYRLKNELRIQRFKTLAPRLNQAHPIIEVLSDDLQYYQKSLTRNSIAQDDENSKKILNDFDLFNVWYSDFQQNGLKPLLEAENKDLFALMNGLFVYSKMSKKHGPGFIASQITEMCKTAQDCLVNVKQIITK